MLSWLRRCLPVETHARTGVPAPAAFQVVEGVSGTFYYHLMATGIRPGSAGAHTLCNKTGVMHTSIPLETWGYRSEHLNERYCPQCTAAAQAQGVVFPRLAASV